MKSAAICLMLFCGWGVTNRVVAEENPKLDSPQWNDLLASEHPCLPPGLTKLTNWPGEITLNSLAELILKEHIAPVEFSGLAAEDLAAARRLPGPITSVPLYQALDWLSEVGLSWHWDGTRIQLYPEDVGGDPVTTRQYDVRALNDQGWTQEELLHVIQDGTTGPWFKIDGIGGTIQAAGPVVIVRHEHRVQMEVMQLLHQLDLNQATA
ncbi:MAG: hypothetical protein KDA80_16955, partial [Planctomycetaceae bacterium]|nr:hypothetical protein [Planctomycetaceae bacterium]